MDFVKIEVPYSQVITNPQVQQLAIAALLGGAKSEGTVNGITTYNNVSNNANTYAMLTYDVIAYIVSLGGNVFNYQSYIAIDLNANVPDYVRNATTIDFEGNVIPLKWSEWIHPNNPSIEIDGKTYISGYAHYAGFSSIEKLEKHLDGKELTSLINDGFEVINQETFLSLLHVQ